MTRRPDEIALREQVLSGGVFKGETPREMGARLGIPPKRVLYLCEKFSREGWYESGVAVDLGWVVG